jgi:uncharacterized membrane protein YbhN (UPF0104 family)
MPKIISSYFSQVYLLVKVSNIGFIILAVTIGTLSSILISLRQKYLFKIVKKDVSLLYLWLAGAASMLASLIAPFYTGSLTFAYFISKKTKVSYPKIFGIVLLDFIIAMIFAVIFGFIGAIVWGVTKPLAAIIFLLLTLALVIFIVKNKSFKVIKTLLKERKLIYKSLAISFLIFILGNIEGYLFFLAFNIHLNLFYYVLATSLFGLLNLIPGLPAKLGQFELLGTLSYWYLLGVDKIQIGAVLLTQHLILLGISIVVGVVALGFVFRKIK